MINDRDIERQENLPRESGGEAIVSKEAVGFVGGVDPATGIVTEREHQLEAQCISGKDLVYPINKGTTADTSRMFEMSVRGTAPKAVVNIEAEAVGAMGAIMAEIPAVDMLSGDPTKIIKSGDWIRVDGDEGMVVILRRKTSGTNGFSNS